MNEQRMSVGREDRLCRHHLSSLFHSQTPDAVAAAATKCVYAAPYEHLQTLLEELLQKQGEVLGSCPIIWLNSGAEAVSSHSAPSSRGAQWDRLANAA